MSLPIAGGGDGQQMRPPTHNEIDIDKLSKLGLELEDVAEDGVLHPDGLEELSQTLGVDESHLYAAAALVTDFEIARDSDVRFEVCGGGCQKWGALEVLDELVQRRCDRLDDDQPTFDIVARRCLDKCQAAPAVLVHTPDGTAVVTEATRETIAEAVDDACGE